MDLRPFACWDWGFESHQGNGCLSLVNVVFCQVEFSAPDHSFGEVLQRVLCLSDFSNLREKRGYDRKREEAPR